MNQTFSLGFLGLQTSPFGLKPSTHLASASSTAAGTTANPVTNTTPKMTNMATHSFEWATNYLQRDTSVVMP